MAASLNMAGLPAPTMDWSSSDLPREFSRFKKLCELMWTGPMADVDEKRKVSFLLLWAGEEGRELAESWNMSGDAKIDDYWAKFEKYVKPKSVFRIARYQLRSLKQQQGETVDCFMKKVRLLARDCNYKDNEEQMLDTLVFGTNSETVQSKLLQKD
jgi:hypothetical protein